MPICLIPWARFEHQIRRERNGDDVEAEIICFWSVDLSWRRVDWCMKFHLCSQMDTECPQGNACGGTRGILSGLRLIQTNKPKHGCWTFFFSGLTVTIFCHDLQYASNHRSDELHWVWMGIGWLINANCDRTLWVFTNHLTVVIFWIHQVWMKMFREPQGHPSLRVSIWEGGIFSGSVRCQ